MAKRKLLSASGQKRHSLLPTPLRSGRITRSQSQRSRPSSHGYDIPGAVPFNISPSAELVKPRKASVSQEPAPSSSIFSDPFSPASQFTTADPVQDFTEDSVARNLIELSPTLPSEVSRLNYSFCHNQSRNTL